MKSNFLKTIVSVLALTLILLNFSTASNAQKVKNITNIQELHKLIVQSNSASLNEDGKFLIHTTSNELDVDPQLFDEYLTALDAINSLIPDGYASFDNNLNLVVPTENEVTNIAHSEESNVSLHSLITPYAVLPDLPKLYISNLVEKNRLDLEGKWEAWKYASKFDPKLNPGSLTIAYFVGKVMPKGPWDYKSVPGYSPWYKEWEAYTYDGKKVLTSEYLGNYNYAYVGQFLFSKSILLKGGAAVGSGVGVPEDDKDRQAISKGYDDAVKYWR